MLDRYFFAREAIGECSHYSSRDGFLGRCSSVSIGCPLHREGSSELSSADDDIVLPSRRYAFQVGCEPLQRRGSSAAKHRLRQNVKREAPEVCVVVEITRCAITVPSNRILKDHSGSSL